MVLSVFNLPRFCSQLEKSRGRLAWSRTNRRRCGLQTNMIGHYLAGSVFLRNLGNHCKPSDQDHMNVPLWLYGPQKCTNQTALLDYISFVSCIIFFCLLFSYFTSFFIRFAWLLYNEFMWYDISSLNGHLVLFEQMSIKNIVIWILKKNTCTKKRSNPRGTFSPFSTSSRPSHFLLS